MLNIENGELRWEIINTRNIDNIALEIDHSEESKSHNEYVCGLLRNQQSYLDYMMPIMRKQNAYNMGRMETVFQPHTVNRSIKVLMNNILHWKKNKQFNGDYIMVQVFRNDIRRSGILRFLLDNK